MIKQSFQQKSREYIKWSQRSACSALGHCSRKLLLLLEDEHMWIQGMRTPMSMRGNNKFKYKIKLPYGIMLGHLVGCSSCQTHRRREDQAPLSEVGYPPGQGQRSSLPQQTTQYHKPNHYNQPQYQKNYHHQNDSRTILF